MRRTSWRTVPPAAGSIFPHSKIFSDSPRRTALVSNRSLADSGAVLVVGGEGDRLLAEVESDLGALEVVARRDLASRLVERIHQLLLVEVAHHVE